MNKIQYCHLISIPSNLSPETHSSEKNHGPDHASAVSLRTCLAFGKGSKKGIILSLSRYFETGSDRHFWPFTCDFSGYEKSARMPFARANGITFHPDGWCCKRALQASILFTGRRPDQHKGHHGPTPIRPIPPPDRHEFPDWCSGCRTGKPYLK